MTINYELAQKRRPAQKSALTRAMKTAPEVRYKKVLAVCRQAVVEWNEVGAFPDDWHRWQIALDDAAFLHSRTNRENVVAPRLTDL